MKGYHQKIHVTGYISILQILLLLLCTFAPLGTNGFTIQRIDASISSRCFPSNRRSSRRMGILDDMDVNKASNGQQLDLQNFNPLKSNRASGSSKQSKSPLNTNQVSLRQMKMKELTNDLLSASGDVDSMNTILQEYESFLLEPLEVDDAVLEPDSIYKAGMSRGERYQTYRLSMDERIQTCKSVQVRQLLELMRDFVLQFE